MEIQETNNSRVKNFISRHKVAITVIATSTAWMLINRRALKQHEDFMAEHGILELFYNPED